MRKINECIIFDSKEEEKELIRKKKFEGVLIAPRGCVLGYEALKVNKGKIKCIGDLPFYILFDGNRWGDITKEVKKLLKQKKLPLDAEIAIASEAAYLFDV